MKKRTFLIALLSLPVIGFLIGIFLGIASIHRDSSLHPTVGSAQTLEAAYNRWKTAAEQDGQATKLVLSLGYFKGLSSEFTQARGTAVLDLINGSLSVEVSGLPEHQAFDIWLIDNRPGPGRSVKPESGDGMIRGGQLAKHGDRAVLATRLDRKALSGFKVDLIAITSNGNNPAAGGLLFGAPNVFQKIYYAKSSTPKETSIAPFGAAENERSTPILALTPFRALIPAIAHADQGGFPNFADLIARGEKLFFEEKFQGNGRTCGTCHPAENNFTIDPAFIATRPKNDPLFVAEFDRNLNSDYNGGKRFEIPHLMRQFGLVLENVDGLDDLRNKFVMRGTPHTLAQALSLTPATFDGTSATVFQRTGWGGDGAPGGGTLREFAIGAVTQHFTRTLDRRAGIDFRLPDDSELDAMEAFMLSLGRQTELNLSTLSFNDPDARLGLVVFNSPSDGKCSLCHFNAGANHGIPLGVPVGTQNANFDTGVENATHPAGAHGALRPRDGGFGGALNASGGYGNGTFNTPSLVEAAEKKTFFHNNLCTTIECAVEFYNSDAFNRSPSARFASISLGQDKVMQVAAFLRSINALENIRAATEKLANASALSDGAERTLPQLQKLFRLASADINDAYRVLNEGKDSQFKPNGLYPEARTWLRYAKDHCEMLYSSRSKAERTYRVAEALNALAAAKDEITKP